MGQLGQVAEVQFGIPAVAGDVGVREKVAQVAVALLRFGQQGQVGAVFKGDLGAGDGLHAHGLGDLGEVHSPAKIVVVGQGQGPVAQFLGAHQELLHRGGSFLERVVAVAMKFSVHGF